MRMTVPRVASMVWLLALGALMLGFTVTATSSLAADTGNLKLMVARCDGGRWIANAQVDVIIYRPGTGQVDSATGSTNSSGYVEFTFTNLEIGDEARTTVTPEGEDSDSGHTYVWTMWPGDSAGGVWDLDVSVDSLCSDGWYNQNNGIIECRYR
jgi:hypothetical protein